jgi:hypothetical protein
VSLGVIGGILFLSFAGHQFTKQRGGNSSDDDVGGSRKRKSKKRKSNK